MTSTAVEPADVPIGGLSNALIELEKRWRELDLPIVAGLQPGLSGTEIRNAWATRGLNPPAEIITWFSWHNGSLPGHAGMANARILDLAEALESQEVNAMLPEHAHWIPITRDRHGGTLCVSASHPAAGQAKVTYLDKIPEPRDDPHTLEQVVRVWVARFDRGDWYRDGDNVNYHGDYYKLLPLIGEVNATLT